jgi:PleD family two-component response regulator
VPKVLVAEPSAPISNAMRKFLAGTADAQLVHFLDEAVQAVRTAAPDVVIASVSGSFDGETLSVQAKKISPQVATILVYPPEEDRAAERATEFGCDAFLVGPVKKAAVINALRTVLALKELRTQVAMLQGEVKHAKAQLPITTRPMSVTNINAVDEAFFKKYMLLEVRRSRRYQYPVAILLLELDRFAERMEKEASPEFQKATIRSEALGAISTMCRDIDLAMPFAEDKFLVFLPHTPREGAVLLAERMVVRMRKLDSLPKATASVGIAVFQPTGDPKVKVSFGGLIREASTHLKAAQAAGGDRVASPATPEQVKKNRISMG